MRKSASIILLLLLGIRCYAGGFGVKTSSVISQPGIEVLGDYKGAWYAVSLETPGNLNKPPMYRFLKYTAGFSGGKTSELYPSFGEKAFYLCSAIINNKISMFYSKCELRADEETLMDKREGHAVMPVIIQQDFDVNTLLPSDSAHIVFDRTDEHFAASGIEIIQSEDRSKSAIVFKPYYKSTQFKVTIYDNNAGKNISKTFDFKDLKSNLQFLTAGISNNGQVYLLTKYRYDIIGYNVAAKEKGVTDVYHIFSVHTESSKPVELTLKSPNGKNNFFSDPLLTVSGNGELLLAADNFSDEAKSVFNGFQVMKYNESLTLTGLVNVFPSEKYIPSVSAYHQFKKGREFSNLQLQQIVPLNGKSFMLLTEYSSFIMPADKKTPTSIERSYMVSFKLDDNLAVKAQHFIPKKQITARIDYAFSARIFKKGNDAYVFYNDDWESDDEHDTNFKCTKLPDSGTSETFKVIHTSDDFFVNMNEFYLSTGSKILFREDHLVDYGDVTKEVKLLEVTIP